MPFFGRPSRVEALRGQAVIFYLDVFRQMLAQGVDDIGKVSVFWESEQHNLSQGVDPGVGTPRMGQAGRKSDLPQNTTQLPFNRSTPRLLLES